MGLSDLPVANGSAHVGAFVRAGWECVRVRGAHHILTRDGHHATLSVPCHRGRDLGRGLLKSLIEAAGMTEAEYLGYFNKTLPKART